ncbi:UvrD-helicase domain-containing protein [Lichenihabitans sp. Uapishka_5]|uniref:UvrD-helicase domain-containing protein n=1 Tax=Lichenihabitans sp. Uapishka_5 TaxID=3037302 RepID=UPI0029E804F3|nr:UvrD-helicase domain-containing protein [Lichenihabitans sp. Uapishka_5]MDX7952871.1 UvrD-helicase domain-containing protein [Lichenihabitans sp. Uapishka_5]
MSAATLNRVDTVLASAGTGKTTFLVRSIADAIGNGMAPERIIATTFTRKAAGELASRLTVHLALEAGPEASAQAASVRVGTINAVCGHLCREFALQLGISPDVRVVDEEHARRLFHVAAGPAMASAAPDMNVLAEAFGLRDRNVDWREQIFQIVTLARANGIGAGELGKSALLSIEGLLALLPNPKNDGAHLDACLNAQIERSMKQTGMDKLRAGSRPAAESLREAGVTMGNGKPLSWPAWASLAVPGTAKSDEALFAGVALAASVHGGHPRLHADLTRYVSLAFHCAAEALDAYDRLKRDRGLLDFTDQETLALKALRDPANLAALEERLGLVLVDEMQDSSPMQISLMLAMASAADRSIWVGDPKQSIFAFRATDATLTLAAGRGAARASGGDIGTLSTSWRSRPGIRSFVADCFVPGFEALGLARGEIAFSEGGRKEREGRAPPISVWRTFQRGKQAQAAAVVGGIVAALAAPAAWPVESNGVDRDLRPEDVALLCRSNEDVKALMLALAAVGIPTASSGNGLFETPEGQLARAAFRWAWDRNDRLALAELARLAGPSERDAAWLDALGTDDPTAALAALVPFARDLDDLREPLIHMSLSEAVDTVLLAGGIHDAVARWQSTTNGSSLLEAVRGLVPEYVSRCGLDLRPVTLGGFCAWIAQDDFPQPGAGSGAVHVLTYHAAKGLEWPLVVCCQLDVPPRVSLFAPTAETSAEGDWRDPLADRWIRFWPWPYGRRSKGIPLDACALGSDVGRIAGRRAREEALRLLYVGFTRARDHLVLITCPDTQDQWLRTLDVGSDHLVPPPAAGEGRILVAERIHPIRSMDVAPAPSSERLRTEWTWSSTTLAKRLFEPLRIAPSTAGNTGRLRALSRHELGPRVRLRQAGNMGQLGSALHAFIASDRMGDSRTWREGSAARLLTEWQVPHCLGPEDLVCMADRLWQWIDVRFPNVTVRREVAVNASAGARTIVGRLDLMLQGDGWFVVMDHKVFPGLTSLWDARPQEHAAQLALYARAVRSATGLECNGTFLHLPLGGVMLEVAVGQPVRRRTQPRRGAATVVARPLQSFRCAAPGSRPV